MVRQDDADKKIHELNQIYQQPVNNFKNLKEKTKKIG